MKKLILCDIDGTMVINDSISRENKETVKRLQDDGHFVTLATGRHYTRAIEVIKELNISLPMISSNGAVIYNPKSNKIIKSHFMDNRSLNLCINLCKREQVEYILYTENTMKASQGAMDELHKMYYETNVDIITPSEEMELLKQDDLVKILIVEYGEIKLKSILRELNHIDNLDCNISDPGLLNVATKSATKGNGLLYLLDYFNVEKQNSIALGNADNDISMILEAQIGVCVGNDSVSLSKVSNIRIKENLEKAFHLAIEKIGV